MVGPVAALRDFPIARPGTPYPFEELNDHATNSEEEEAAILTATSALELLSGQTNNNHNLYPPNGDAPYNNQPSLHHLNSQLIPCETLKACLDVDRKKQATKTAKKILKTSPDEYEAYLSDVCPYIDTCEPSEAREVLLERVYSETNDGYPTQEDYDAAIILICMSRGISMSSKLGDSLP